MSEPKRVPLQNLELPDSLGPTAKKAEKTKQLAPSFRFELTLLESNERTCPEFNYAQLLRAAEKKRKKESKGKDENNTNGLDPFASDDEDQLKEMAKRFEAKYGSSYANTSKSKKRHKYDGYIDLGAGYDENDSFIDNTDAYDEIVPEEVTTAHGGFYINCGALEFKQAEGDHLITNNNDNNDNDNDDDDESSEEEAEDADSPKRSDKRDNSSSEEEELDQTYKKTNKMDDTTDKKSNNEALTKKKQNQSVDIGNKRKLEEKDTVENNHDDNESKHKKLKTDSKNKFNVKNFVKPSSTNGVDIKKTEYKKSDKVDASIESVVNAARAEDESSRDTFDSGKSRGPPGSDSECDDTDKGETRVGLPEGLPENVKEAVNKMKIHGETNKNKKSFTGAMNNDLLSLDKKLRYLNPPNIRIQVYEHLAQFLHCSRGTLVSRAKKLSVQEAENRVKDPVQRLKTIVEGIMPSLIEKYNKECQRIAEEKNMENNSIDLEANDRNGNTQKILDNMPLKKFPWTDETKKLIHDIASARKSYFKIAKPRRQSVEDFITSYLKSEVLTLWPTGWMDMSTLLKYANPDSDAKKKHKPKESSVPPAQGSNPSPIVRNSNSTHEVSNTNYTQEPATNKTPVIKNSVLPSLEITKVEPPKSEHQVTSLNFQNVIKSTSGTEIKPVIKYKEKHESIAPTNHAPTTKQPSQSQSQQPPSANTDWSEYSEHSKKIMAQFAFDLPTIKNDLSITPVNDYQKAVTKAEVKKDVVSITPYNEPVPLVPDSHFVSTSSSRLEPVDLKNHIEEKDPLEILKAEKRKQKKRERYMDNRHKPHEVKKRREDEGKDIFGVNKESSPLVSQLTKEEQEQRQIEETMAATNVLSQLINECPIPGVIEETITGDQVTDVEKEEQEVHDVIKSLKELEKLRERSSPSHSPMRVNPSSGIYLRDFQEDYHRYFPKKDEKMRIHKKDGHW